jgi:hypothetical protein
VDEQHDKGRVDDTKRAGDKPTPEDAKLERGTAADRKAIEDVMRAAGIDKRPPDKTGS